MMENETVVIYSNIHVPSKPFHLQTEGDHEACGSLWPISEFSFKILLPKNTDGKSIVTVNKLVTVDNNLFQQKSWLHRSLKYT
jgi:hypothetical protein